MHLLLQNAEFRKLLFAVLRKRYKLMKKILNKIATFTMSLIITAGTMAIPAQRAHATEIPFLFQGQTSLEAGNDVFDYTTGDFNNDGIMDLYALKKYNTGTGTAELHILDGKSNYKSFLFQAGLPFETGDKFKFTTGDYNSDGKLDLLVMKKNTGHSNCEIHILDGNSNYKNFLVQKVIPLESADYWGFAAADYNGDKKLDLYMVKNSPSARKCEVHILDGRSEYADFIEQRVLPVETGTHFSFCTGELNGDQKPDLYVLKRNNTGTGTTEIHVLSGADGYQSFLLQSGIKLETGDNFVFASYDYNRNGYSDLVAVKRRSVPKTEVHILNVSRSGSSSNAGQTAGGTLHSPVPSGCRFNTKTYDNGWYGYHDINRGVSSATPVYAVADGTVTYKQAYRIYGGVKKLTSYGNFIEFRSSNGAYTAKYCHLSRFVGVDQIISSSRTVRASGRTGVYSIATRSVKKGEVIGYIGQTGNASGVHLHFELRKNGSRIDPTSVISGLK